MIATVPLRHRVLSALRDGPLTVSEITMQARGNRGDVSSAVSMLLHYGHARRIGAAPRTKRQDRRPVELTAAGRRALAQAERAAQAVSMPPSKHRALPLLMVAHGGVWRRDYCERYCECLAAAAIHLPHAAQCPTVCVSFVARVEHATDYAASGRSNDEASIYVGGA